MLNELNDEQKALMSIVRDEWVNAALGGNTEIDEGEAKKWLDFCYGKIGKKAPRFEIVGGPYEAQVMANKENGNKTMEHYPSGIGLSYDSGWTSFYDFFTRIGVLANAEFNSWLAFRRAGIWDALLFENIAYLVRRPSLVLKDSQGRLHCENGPAVLFPNGEKHYRWHAVNVPARLIMNAGDVTREDLLAERNAEVTRAWGEKIGWTKFLSLIEAVLIDSHRDKTTGLTYALYDLKNRPSPEFARFLKMESPELNDGNCPYYVEPVHPKLATAMAARKWKCAIDVNGNRPTPEECNADSALAFSLEA